jgi:glycerophosphoryl diester phosphodiesterase
MEILAHRGWWKHMTEQNTRTAFARALTDGYGIETDIRDCLGNLVISHDMPREGADPERQMSLAAFLDLYLNFKSRPTLALNIKSDGLAALLNAELSKRAITSYFVFDMSVPDTLGYIANRMQVFTRRSDFESGSNLDLRAQGLWLDAFDAPHVTGSQIISGIETGRSIAIVSPELHKKPHVAAWDCWRRVHDVLTPAERKRVMLCTDTPREADRFFN